MRPNFKRCLKVGLTIGNAILVCVGGMLVTGGIIVKFYTELLNGYMVPLVKILPAGGGTGTEVWVLYNTAALSLILFGSVVFCLGFVGCFVSNCPSFGTSVTYLVVMTMTICCQVTAAALLFTMDIEPKLAETLRANLQTKYAGGNASDEYSCAWNYIFVENSCCGLTGVSSEEFETINSWTRPTVQDANGNVTSVTIPVTCCKLPAEYPNFGTPNDVNCTSSPTTQNSNIDKTCYSAIYDYLQYFSIAMSVSTILSALLEGLSLALAVWMSVDRKREKLVPGQDKMMGLNYPVNYPYESF